MRDFAVFDVAAHLYYLEPSKVVDRFRRFIKCSPYRLVTSGRGTTGNLYSFEYFTLHDCPPRDMAGGKSTPFVPSINRIAVAVIRRVHDETKARYLQAGR